MNANQVAAKAKELRDQGLFYGQIARVLFEKYEIKGRSRKQLSAGGVYSLLTKVYPEYKSKTIRMQADRLTPKSTTAPRSELISAITRLQGVSAENKVALIELVVGL